MALSALEQSQNFLNNTPFFITYFCNLSRELSKTYEINIHYYEIFFQCFEKLLTPAIEFWHQK